MRLPKPMRRVKAPRPPRRGKRPRKRRRGKQASLGRMADKLWGQIVRHAGRCERCGATDRIQGAHGISRRYRSTRWLPLNGFALCSGCHVTMTHDPLAWDDYLRKAWGPDVYDTFRRMAQKQAKPDLEAIVESLRCELFKLEGLPPREEAVR